MSFKRYQNEMIVSIAFLLMLFAYLYKEVKVSYQSEAGRSVQQKIDEINKVIALKKLWDDPRIPKRLDKLKQIVPEDKITWSKKRTELHVVYTGINAEALNQVSKTILNLGVQIKKFDLQREGTSYKVELVCKW